MRCAPMRLRLRRGRRIIHFWIEGDRPGEVPDAVAVDLDAPVGEEELETIPVAGNIGEFLAEVGLGRDAGALLLQPVAEGLD